jgi:hypothetical protein
MPPHLSKSILFLGLKSWLIKMCIKQIFSHLSSLSWRTEKTSVTTNSQVSQLELFSRLLPPEYIIHQDSRNSGRRKTTSLGYISPVTGSSLYLATNVIIFRRLSPGFWLKLSLPCRINLYWANLNILNRLLEK